MVYPRIVGCSSYGYRAISTTPDLRLRRDDVVALRVRQRWLSSSSRTPDELNSHNLPDDPADPSTLSSPHEATSTVASRQHGAEALALSTDASTSAQWRESAEYAVKTPLPSHHHVPVALLPRDVSLVAHRRRRCRCAVLALYTRLSSSGKQGTQHGRDVARLMTNIAARGISPDVFTLSNAQMPVPAFFTPQDIRSNVRPSRNEGTAAFTDSMRRIPLRGGCRYFVEFPAPRGACGPSRRFPLPPNRRRHARAPSVKDATGVGYPFPPTEYPRDCREGLRKPFRSKYGNADTVVKVNFSDLKPPEACARILGEGCGRGGAPLTPVAYYLHDVGEGCCKPFRAERGYDLAVLADLKSPEARMRALGDKRGRGGDDEKGIPDREIRLARYGGWIRKARGEGGRPWQSRMRREGCAVGSPRHPLHSRLGRYRCGEFSGSWGKCR
ncbi:uncharacterized protein SCHCODRAFT_02599668 [Schizophyllum commune H4-8]|uniref:Uncharacterized protein n=1 Tax=Schizophyllum commune (strain H4-8 / FGSC 9210) TaxID=578458 RepID=D8Q5L4_SCHCM|nr:uncharacterized protein SCHCODRAFT_02599668 [Schizophyllum commune H4-8]KAI5892134.1 hypothetical protein SCHCODRAFT_02599668 [Schizophyllum commune H4-8]